MRLIMEVNKNIIPPAINPVAQIKVQTNKILMDRTIIANRPMTEEQKLNVKPLFS